MTSVRLRQNLNVVFFQSAAHCPDGAKVHGYPLYFCDENRAMEFEMELGQELWVNLKI